VACEWLLLQRRDRVGAVLRKENHAVICVAVFFGRVARVKPSSTRGWLGLVAAESRARTPRVSGLVGWPGHPGSRQLGRADLGLRDWSNVRGRVGRGAWLLGYVTGQNGSGPGGPGIVTRSA